MNIIYLDILFLSNLTFDLLSVYMTAHFTDTKLHPFRAFFGCMIGSLTAVWLVVWCRRGFLFFLSAFLSLILMVFLSFSPKSPGSFFRLSVVLLFSLFLSGAVAYYLLRWAIFEFGVAENADSDGKALLFSLISVVTGGVLSLSSKAMQRQNQKQTVLAKVKWRGNDVKCPCLVDSGNLLKDPIDGKPVLLLPKEVAKQLLQNEEIVRMMADPDLDISLADIESIYQSRMRIVPYHTINKSGVMLCFMADEVLIDSVEKNALVGVCPVENREMKGICPKLLLS